MNILVKMRGEELRDKTIQIIDWNISYMNDCEKKIESFFKIK